MRFYLDTSVAVHAALPAGDPRARAWLASISGPANSVCSSSLLRLEMVRVLRRERLDPVWARLVTDRVDLISIDDGILRFAETIEDHVKSLDAIHLATCALISGDTTLVTHDAAMASAAVHQGFDVYDPLAD